MALLALLGLLDSLYLSLERLTGGALVCPTGGGCEAVQSSAYALLAGIPVAYLGVAGYGLLLGLALIALQRERVATIALAPLLLGLASLGLAFSAYLVYLQLGVIGAICFWCMVSATLELVLWLAALINWRRTVQAHRAPQRSRQAAPGRAQKPPRRV